MVCKNCGNQIGSKNGAFCGRCGARWNVDINNHTENKVVSKPKKSKSVIVLVILIVLLSLSLVAALLFMYFDENGSSKSDNVKEKTEQTELVKEELTEKDEDEEEKNNFEEDKPPVNSGIKYNDGELEFDFYAKQINTAPVYEVLNDINYSYYCAKPNHFVEVDERTYCAPDSTALMKIEAKSNSNGSSVEQAMQEYINLVEGEVTYSVYEDTWFAVSIRKDGIAYYKKCFVDHYIRSFEFNFPEKYIDIYDKYINYIEDNFKRTDA